MANRAPRVGDTLAPSRKRAFEMRRLASSSGPPMGASTVQQDSGHRLVPCGWDTRRLQYKSQARAVPMAARQRGQTKASCRPNAPCAKGTSSQLRQAIPEGSRAPRRARPRQDARWCSRCKRAFEMRRLASSGSTADGSFNRATRLGPSSCALWMGHEKASVQVTGSGSPHGGLARGADKGIG